MSSPTDPRAAGAGGPPSASPSRYASLGALFARTLSALERSLAFDHAELALPGDADAVHVLASRTGGDGAAVESLATRGHYSQRLWSAADTEPRIIRDAAAELDRDHDA